MWSAIRATTNFDRAQNEAADQASFLGHQNGYGCWCYFGDSHNDKLAKGQPLDAYDEMCRQLYRGYECTIIDSLDGDACIPWNVTYTDVSLSQGTDYATECATVNAGD